MVYWLPACSCRGMLVLKNVGPRGFGALYDEMLMLVFTRLVCAWTPRGSSSIHPTAASTAATNCFRMARTPRRGRKEKKTPSFHSRDQLPATLLPGTVAGSVRKPFDHPESKQVWSLLMREPNPSAQTKKKK